MHSDVVIVGSGPAGVSAAFPLVHAGLRVLMLDAGQDSGAVSIPSDFLQARRSDSEQWRWMVGEDFHALRHLQAVSPKLRVPTHARVFQGFASANRIISRDFLAVGSIAQGGLSNAWGCGVACLTDAELASFPVSALDMRSSYAAVCRRIGVSGGQQDDLSEFFGLDEWAQPAVPADELQAGLLAKYSSCRGALHKQGFRLGRSRVAVATEPLNDRQPCDRSGMCMWGCKRGALYSARDDLILLRRLSNFTYVGGQSVERILTGDGAVQIQVSNAQGKASFSANRVLLAAGTLASTRLALLALNHRRPVPMQSCPTAAFMMWLPAHLGRSHGHAFGLGQLSFSLELNARMNAFGSLFNTTGIPVSEFVRHLPLAKRYAIDLLQPMLSSCVVGNLFLPGSMTVATLALDANEHLVVSGSYHEEVPVLMRQAHALLRRSFLRLGAVVLPGSFKVGKAGADIHYAASLPMRADAQPGETDPYGALVGAPGIHVVDGASLSHLPAKSHTLTIMANADRIGRHLTHLLRDRHGIENH